MYFVDHYSMHINFMHGVVYNKIQHSIHKINMHGVEYRLAAMDARSYGYGLHTRRSR